jgi:hypothetical protein
MAAGTGAVGRLSPSHARKALKPNGVYLNVHRHAGGRETLDDLLLIHDLIEAGRLKPVIEVPAFPLLVGHNALRSTIMMFCSRCGTV